MGRTSLDGRSLAELSKPAPGQGERKSGPLADLAFGFELSFVFLDDVVADRQSESCSDTHTLGGEPRVEDVTCFFGFDARTRV